MLMRRANKGLLNLFVNMFDALVHTTFLFAMVFTAMRFAIWYFSQHAKILFDNGGNGMDRFVFSAKPTVWHLVRTFGIAEASLQD